MRQQGFGSLTHPRTITALTLSSLLCWVALALLHFLPTYYAVPAFALDKLPGHFASPVYRATTLLFLALTLLYSVGLWAIARARPLSRPTRRLLLLWFAGSGVALLFLHPITAVDVYTYLNVLKGTYFYGQNPYLVTVSSRMATDPWAAYDFFAGNPATYGPGWLVLSGIPALFIRWDDLLSGLLALKGFNLLLVGLTGLVIARYQDDPRERWLAAWLFMANPLVLYEAVGVAHNDIYAIAALAAALWALKRRSALALPLLALSVSVKFLTITLLPFFAAAMLAERWGWPRLALSAGLSLAVVVGVAAPFWAGGQMVGGLLNSAQDYYRLPGSSVLLMAHTYLWLAGHTGQSALFILPALALPVAAVCAWGVWRVRRGASLALAGAATLLAALQFLTRYCQWYLMYPLLLVALDRRGAARRWGGTLLTAMTAVNLAWYPVVIWAFTDSGLSVLGVQWLGVAVLTLPSLALVGWWAWGEGGLRDALRRRPAANVAAGDLAAAMLAEAEPAADVGVAAPTLEEYDALKEQEPQG